MTTKKLAEDLGISTTRIRQLKQELGLVEPLDWVWVTDPVSGKPTADYTERGQKAITERNKLHYSDKSGRPKKEYPLESGGVIGAASPTDDPSSVGARQSLLSEEKMQELEQFIADRAAQQQSASTK